jgi:hypothetical protein
MNNENDSESEMSDGEDKVSDNPFRAARLNVYSTYLPTNNMEAKLKYTACIKKMGPRPEHNYFQVYAYAEPPMRVSGWKNIFKSLPPLRDANGKVSGRVPVSVKKIDGPFDENIDYKEKLDKGQLAEWGVRPYRTKILKKKAK